MCNSMLYAWIFNSLDKSLQVSVAYAVIAKEMLDDLTERFFPIKSEIRLLRQDGVTGGRVLHSHERILRFYDSRNDYRFRFHDMNREGRILLFTIRFYDSRCHDHRPILDKIAILTTLVKIRAFLNCSIEYLEYEPLPSICKIYCMVVQEERQGVEWKESVKLDQMRRRSVAGVDSPAMANLQKGTFWQAVRKKSAAQADAPAGGSTSTGAAQRNGPSAHSALLKQL
ncbi:hypothetical protein CRG98_018500 [Punica granatum]|uniref:Uncharacterized protein n=1 Tax=Punica granatum TaxID=22663 RepID=A0A2I0JXP4_PUNGR|nr:hypothetical protein CRG98_018500 [Punica granatum]